MLRDAQSKTIITNEGAPAPGPSSAPTPRTPEMPWTHSPNPAEWPTPVPSPARPRLPQWFLDQQRQEVQRWIDDAVAKRDANVAKLTTARAAVEKL